MSIKTMRYALGIALYGVLAIGSAGKADASIASYHVSLDTGFLGTSTSYFLDFQFTAGDTSEAAPNTISVTSDDGQFAAFDLTAGLVPGSGENIVEFVPANPTAFTLAFTDYVSPLTPDLLSLYICDGSFNCVPTTDPSGFNTIISFTESVDPASPGIDLIQYYDTATQDLNTSVSPVSTSVETPEPVGLAFGGTAILVAMVWRTRRKS
jgi:hypothetical protein